MRRVRRAAVAAALVVTAGSAVVGPAPGAAGADCRPGHFCAYSGANYTGSVTDYYYCSNKYMPYTTYGSWINNQTSGTKARFYDINGKLIYTTAGAYSVRNSGVYWTPVYSIKPC